MYHARILRSTDIVYCISLHTPYNYCNTFRPTAWFKLEITKTAVL